MLVRISDPLAKSCSIHPCHPTLSDSLEERLGKAKSSMALRTCLMYCSILVYTYKMEENFLVPSVQLDDKFGFTEKILDNRRNIFYITEEISRS